MSKRSYPTNPAVPTQPGYPPPGAGGGVMNSGYPGPGGQNLNPYQNYAGQPRGGGTSQPPPPSSIGAGGSGAYPRQVYPGASQPMYPGPPSGQIQSWGAPPTNLSSSTPSGGYGPQVWLF